MSSATPSTTSHVDPIVEESKKYFTFFNLSIFLIAVTAIELVIVYIPVNSYLVYTSLIVLSLFKFAGVIWWFMHLRWDRLLCTVLFLIGFFLAAGTVTALLLLFEAAPAGAPGA